MAGTNLATPTPLLAVGGSGALPPGEYSIELDLTYLLVTTVGSNEPVTFSTVIPLSPELTSENLTASGDGEILDDIAFTIEEVAAHHVGDWIIRVDAALDQAASAEPLLLHFDFDGQGHSIINETIQLEAHMDVDAIDHEYSLALPLEEGASRSFDVEVWKDIQECTVVLHLKCPGVPSENREPRRGSGGVCVGQYLARADAA